MHYAEAIRTLNDDLAAKTATLAKETRQWAEAEKGKTNLLTELAAFCEQMEKAKADVVVEFQTL